jgi:hypothetical protein
MVFITPGEGFFFWRGVFVAFAGVFREKWVHGVVFWVVKRGVFAW